MTTVAVRLALRDSYAAQSVTAGFESMVPEAKLEQTEHGFVPKGEGWFVLNMRDAAWRHADGRGAVCVVLDDFEGERQAEQFGVNPFVLAPGEAVLIVEGEERQLRAWDFVHCPPNTMHVVVGAGSEPCLVIAVGARAHDSLGFPADDVAQRHGTSVDQDTTDGGVAYASVPGREPTAYRDGWLPE